MASLFLSVGDFQLTVVESTLLPEERDTAEWQGADEPGDHLITVWEHGTRSRITTRVGEARALEVVGAWLKLETPSETEEDRRIAAKYFGDRFLP